MPESRRSDRLIVATLIVAVAAFGVAIWALMRSPSSDGAGSVTTEQSAEAKQRVCTAFGTVRSAVSLQTNADLGKDKVATQAVAANARLATLGGGQYLLSQLDHAVPGELSDAVTSFAHNLQDIGMGQLAGAPAEDPAQATRLKEAQASATRIGELCA